MTLHTILFNNLILDNSIYIITIFNLHITNFALHIIKTNLSISLIIEKYWYRVVNCCSSMVWILDAHKIILICLLFLILQPTFINIQVSYNIIDYRRSSRIQILFVLKRSHFIGSALAVQCDIYITITIWV